MASTVTLKVSDALTEMAKLCPGGLAQAGCEGAIDTLSGLMGNLSITLPTPQALLDELNVWKQKAEDLQAQLDLVPGGDGESAAPGVPLLPGGDPMEPLRRLAEAINEAESKLNAQNLVIASGSAEVSLVVEVGGAVAQANVRLDIQPRPFQ